MSQFSLENRSPFREFETGQFTQLEIDGANTRVRVLSPPIALQSIAGEIALPLENGHRIGLNPEIRGKNMYVRIAQTATSMVDGIGLYHGLTTEEGNTALALINSGENYPVAYHAANMGEEPIGYMLIRAGTTGECFLVATAREEEKLVSASAWHVEAPEVPTLDYERILLYSERPELHNSYLEQCVASAGPSAMVTNQRGNHASFYALQTTSAVLTLPISIGGHDIRVTSILPLNPTTSDRDQCRIDFGGRQVQRAIYRIKPGDASIIAWQSFPQQDDGNIEVPGIACVIAEDMSAYPLNEPLTPPSSMLRSGVAHAIYAWLKESLISQRSAATVHRGIFRFCPAGSHETKILELYIAQVFGDSSKIYADQIITFAQEYRVAPMVHE